MTRNSKRRAQMKFFENVALLLILLIRGLLLWVLIPFGFLAWVVVHVWAQDASLRQALAWYDGTVFALLMKGPFRLVIPPERRVPFVGMSRMGKIEAHRVRFSDLVDFSTG